jgi:hypothetical protein
MVIREQSFTTGGHMSLAQHGLTTRIARTLIARTLAYFSEHEAKSLTQVRSHLLELLDAKPSLGQGQNLRSAYVLLGRYGSEFNRALQKTLADGLVAELAVSLPAHRTSSVTGTKPDHALDGMSLSLIDIDEVERILLLDRVAQRFNTRYEAVLEPLTQRLGVLFGRESGSAQDNPFQPLVLLRAFLKAWDKCGLDPKATDDLLQSLEPACWLDMAPLYEELNDALKKAGVPAKRELLIKRSTSNFAPLGDSMRGTLDTAYPPSQSASLGAGESTRSGFMPVDAAPRSAWAALAPAGRSVAAQARQFLQRLGLGARSDASHATGDPDSMGHARPVFEQADPAFMGFLGDLQAGASDAAPRPWMEGQDPSDQNVLRQMRDRDEVRRAPELDRGTVDALAEVFDFVFADQAIPMQMKVIIGRLQIPVLKAAMIDRDFFFSDQHPARRLVDTLAGASVEWAPEKGENDPLYVRIETTVQRVLTEFEDDLELFVNLLRDFTEFLFESEQQAQARVEPAAQQEFRSESREQALSQADELIHERIRALPSDQPLVPFLVPFLTLPWRDVVARSLLGESLSAAACQQALKTMDQLIWSTRPKTTADQRRELVSILPDLVRQLNLGLDAIEWDGNARAVFTRRLITTHTLAIRMTQSAAVDTGMAELEVREGQVAMQKLDDRLAARQFTSEDEFDGQAQSFSRGMWFDVTVDAGTQARCKLSWVSPMRTRLLFTNRDGFDAFVRSEREVAAMLRLDQLRVLDQEPIVARALDQIMAGQDMQLAA